MATVQSGLASTGFQRVLVTGHSLGAAVASLDAAMLRMALPDDVQVDSVVFGLPRVGNQEWADLFDTLVSTSYIQIRNIRLTIRTHQIPNFIHVTNQNDPVPNVPPHALDFEHPSGEVHITSVDDTTGNATMVACSGQENQVSTLMHSAARQMTETSSRPQNCAAGNSLLDVSIPNHLGPYLAGISFGGKACPA